MTWEEPRAWDPNGHHVQALYGHRGGLGIQCSGCGHSFWAESTQDGTAQCEHCGKRDRITHRFGLPCQHDGARRGAG